MKAKLQPLVKDLLIVGSGAVGLYGWYCANLLQLSGYIVEVNSKPGGQILTPMACNRRIRDLPCILKITGLGIWKKLQQQIKSVPPTLILITNSEPLKLKIYPSYFQVILSTKQKIMVKNIIITSGNGAFKPQRWEIEEQFNNVFYQPAIQKKQFKNQTITVLGGGDGAITTALELIERAKARHVNFVCKRSFLRAKSQLVNKLKTKLNVSWFLGYTLQPKQIKKNNNLLQSITVTNQAQSETKIITSDYYIIQYGLVMNLTTIQKWPVKLNEQHKIIINQQSETNIPGIYAAGDVACYFHKMYSLVVGFGEIANAIYNILQKQDEVIPTYFGDQHW